MDKYDEIVKLYEQEHYRFELFMNGVYDYFRLAPALREEPLPLVHSLKSRLRILLTYAKSFSERILQKIPLPQKMFLNVLQI